MSAVFINLENKTLNIYMSPPHTQVKEDPIKTDRAMHQTKLITDIFSNQRTNSNISECVGFSNFFSKSLNG